MRVTTFVVTIIVFAGCAGCKPDTPDRLIISLDSGWYVRISPDGSGLLGYGSTGQDSAPLPKGTFRFTDVLEALSASSQKQPIARAHTYSISKSGVAEADVRYMLDDKMLQGVFQTARAATTNPHLDRLWRERPPFSHPRR
jgi:hypothetical protein